jgi:hypothetical protein
MSRSRKPRLSLILSFIACVLCLAAIPVVMICLPSTATKYLSEHEPILMEDIAFIITMLYIGMAVAAAVLVLLICLLRVCRKGSIFTPVSGRLVLAIALLVIAEGGVFALLGLVYRPALAITVVAVTMGLCFTVVSQVLREAAALKEENDGTI